MTHFFLRSPGWSTAVIQRRKAPSHLPAYGGFACAGRTHRIPHTRQRTRKAHATRVGRRIAYVSSLTDGLPRLDSIDSYLKIVKDKSLLRHLIFTAQNIINNCIEAGEEVEDLIAEAESAVMRVGDAQLRSGLSNPRQIVEDYAGGVGAFLDPSKRVRGLSTPFLEFDERTTGLHAGELIVLAGRPAMGKTALALNIAQHVASAHPDKPGRPVAIFSLEMSKESLLTRMLCAAARVDSHRFRGGYLNQQERRRLSAALSQLVDAKLFIDDSGGTTMMDISAKCRRLKSEHGLALIIVDYMQLMSVKGRYDSRVQEISALTRGLKLPGERPGGSRHRAVPAKPCSGNPHRRPSSAVERLA